ncbi:MAG: ATP-binding protein [Nostocaceae cyanobacterium]|nr:ATP-binding protein [Nostocaceae cyanobacterium]
MNYHFLPKRLYHRSQPFQPTFLRFSHWLGHLNLRHKIGWGYTLALGIGALGTSAGIALGDYYSNHALKLEEDARKEVELFNRLQTSILQTQIHNQHLIFVLEEPARLQEEYSELLKYSAELKQAWFEFRSSEGATKDDAAWDIPDEVEGVRRFLNKYKGVPEAYLQEIETLLQRGQIQTTQSDLIKFNNSSVVLKLDRFLEDLAKLTERSHQEYEQAEEELVIAQVLRFRVIAGSMVLSVAIAVLSALWTSHLITRPLQAATQVAQRVTQESDFDLQAPVTTDDEVGVLATALNRLIGRVKQLLQEQAEANKKLELYSQTLEQTVQRRTQELNEKNAYLQQTLQELQQTQTHLIQSEKMAVLGQLVAGIAHEINTPLGVIGAAIGNISYGLEQSMQQLPQLFQTLPSAQLADFFTLLETASQPKEPLSFRQERQLRGQIAEKLASWGVENADILSDNLSQMGISPDLDAFMPLLRAKNSCLIVETAYHLSMVQSNAQNIRLAVERAAKIVFALKSYARQDTKSEMVISSITDGIDTVLTLYHNQIKQGIEITKAYAGVPSILCYPEELTQVWSNLIHNAIQAMNYQGELAIAAWEQEQHVVVKITDSGCGIPLEIQSKIFEPAFTTKPVGEGCGLGLDIVRQIIVKHRGKIEVESQPGHTTFSVWLPIIHG